MIKLLIVAWTAFLLAACGGPARRADKNAERTELCGGYTDQRTPTTQETALLRSLTARQDSVRYTVESVATQVVAGTNYRFVCRVRAIADGVTEMDGAAGPHTRADAPSTNGADAESASRADAESANEADAGAAHRVAVIVYQPLPGQGEARIIRIDPL